jgi:glycosyltransferase involved in cell wall biosynthesis
MISRHIKDALKRNRLLKDGYYFLKANFSKNQGDNSYKYYNYPWQTELEVRMDLLRRAKASKTEQPTIVFLYPEPDAGTFRYRVYNQMQILNEDLGVTSVHFNEGELDDLAKNIRDVDLLVLCRFTWSSKVAKLISQFKSTGKTVLYDFDDLIFDVDSLPQIIEQIDAKPEEEGFYFYYSATRYLLAKSADEFTTTNQFLADKISEYFSKKSSVIPNFLNKKQLKVSQEIYTQKREKTNNAKFTIGYFSGTKTHNRDFALVADTLIEIMTQYKNVNLHITGLLELPAAFDRFRNRITKTGLKNYVDLQYEISKCDINLVPLPLNDFANSKSEIKYFEAAIVGVPTLAVPTYTFSKAITHEQNGFIAEVDKWKQILSDVITGKYDLDRIARNARIHSIENYSGKKIEENISRTYAQFL